MWDFFVYLNSPITSVSDVVIPSWLDPWRYSQLADYKRNFMKGGWSNIAWNEFQKTMEWALSNNVNSALTLRLPGVLSYTRDVVLNPFQEYMDGLISKENVKMNVTQGWNDATIALGKLSQVQIYRASLGLDPLSEFDLCRLHRVEMNAKDNTVCVKYDPQNTSTNVILVAVLVPLLALVLVGAAILVYLEHKRRHSDAIWKIDKSELKFDNPPEIAGRGTFGLVVKAEYRGTTVAVKRVIPPKDRLPNSNLFDDESPLESGAPNESYPSNLKALIVKQARKNSTASISWVEAEKEKEKSNSTAVHDLESGAKNVLDGQETVVTATSSQLQYGSAMSSQLQYGSVMSSQLHSGGMESSNKSKWKRFLGYNSTSKNYEQLKQDFIVEMRILSKLRHPCITTVCGFRSYSFSPLSGYVLMDILLHYSLFLTKTGNGSCH
jgi:hypothetical protein